MRIVHLVQSVLPYGPTTAVSRAAQALPVAQAAAGLEVSVVALAPAHEVDAVVPNQGLARRLSPLEVAGEPAFSAEVLEGTFTGSRVRLFLLVCPADVEPTAAFGRAAVALLASMAQHPNIVHLHQVTGVDADAIREATGGPAVVQTVYDAREEAPSLVAAIRDADAVVVPCAGLSATDTDPPPAVAVALAQHASVRVVPPAVEMAQWSPAHDAALAAPYAADRLQGRAACREALQRLVGLPPRADVPILAVWSRGGADGGLGGLGDVMQELGTLDLQVVALPTGGSEEAAFLAELESRPSAVVAANGNPTTLRALLGGADAVLLPDTVAPLGQRALIALRYGLVPIARRVHAHRDVLVEYDARSNSGGAFLFDGDEEIFQAVHRMTRAFADDAAWASMVRANLLVDSSWERSLAQLEQVYKKALAK